MDKKQNCVETRHHESALDGYNVITNNHNPYAEFEWDFYFLNYTVVLHTNNREYSADVTAWLSLVCYLASAQ